ncbi:DUF4419 domain-containing protein [Kitasatospora sp. NPDC088351]|uniref:DUF4419 domain-containing protein n=1 Tax=Kitasatospora sp. NPDC088351 TaxID=3155180 RepID=UPI0034282E09
MIIDVPLAEGEPGDVREPTAVGNDGFLAAVVGGGFRIHHRSTATLLDSARPRHDPAEGEPSWSLLVRAAHLAFAGHLPLSLSPDVLWYAVVHEIAVHLRLNAEQYAGLFTRTPGERSTITVRDDSLFGPDPDWARSIRLVREPLEQALGAETVELFQPSFSTTTPDDVSAALVALMDVVSPYYEFRWESLCGIPRIRLEGTADDWRLLASRVGELEQWFDGLRPWFADLRPVLDTIARAAAGEVDEEFWRSLYTWESMSGGDFVSGWITAFFAHTQTPDGPRPRETFGWHGRQDRRRRRRGRPDGRPDRPVRFLENDFPSHVSKVPFQWEQPGGIRAMAFVAGVLGVERDGEFVRPRLGHAVLEIDRAGV